MAKILAYILVLCLLAGPVFTVRAQEMEVPEEEPETSVPFDSIRGSGAPVSVRTIPDTAWQQLRSDEDFWYLQAQKPPLRKPEPAPWFQQSWFRNALVGLIALGFIALMAWYLFLSKSRWRKDAGGEADEEGGDPEENIFTLDYEQAIRRAVQEKNYRGAVRLHFLSVLRMLAERGLIQYKQDRTNSAYVQQLFKTPYYQPFFRLTRLFEYIWYGHQPVTPERYEQLQAEFLTFKQGLPS